MENTSEDSSDIKPEDSNNVKTEESDNIETEDKPIKKIKNLANEQRYGGGTKMDHIIVNQLILIILTII